MITLRGTWTGVLVAALMTGAACGGRAASSGYSPGPLASSEQNLMGVWFDARGRALPDGTEATGWEVVVRTESGSPTCSSDLTTVFLELSWPIGRPIELERLEWGSNVVRYIRDSARVMSEVYGPSDLDVELPTTSTSTGFNREGNTISVGVEQRTLYVTRPDGRTERWARLRGSGPGCG